jgi:hypothetical protein
MLHGNETKADAGRIVVTVRPIVRAAADWTAPGLHPSDETHLIQ